MIGSCVTGAFPRPPVLIQATRDYERERISTEELAVAFSKATIKVVEAQTSAGLTYITDGMLRWQDLLRPFARSMTGVECGYLTRWFNNNTFYRKPIITGRIRLHSDIIKRTTYLDKLPGCASWKAVLPAPYTLASLSENRFYNTRTDLLFRFAELLNEEMRNLVAAGFTYIQLSDPSLVHERLPSSLNKKRLSRVKEALETAVKGVAAKICLQTFFGDFLGILPEALDFPVDHLGIDLYATDLPSLRDYEIPKGLALGVVDSRNSLVESPQELASAVVALTSSVHSSDRPDVLICPNCDLDFLPWDRAEKKLGVLRSVAKLVREGLCG